MKKNKLKLTRPIFEKNGVLFDNCYPSKDGIKVAKGGKEGSIEFIIPLHKDGCVIDFTQPGFKPKQP